LLSAGARDRDLSSIKIYGGGADLFPDELVTTFRGLGRRGSRKALFIRGYGMAEANSYVTQTPPFECGDACVGWVMPPVKFRLVDEEGKDVPRGEPGELLLKGPNITTQYWNDAEATRDAVVDGWFHTGDVLRQGKWRMLYFVARTKEIIKSGGYKISASEIDNVLRAHPDIAQVATVGVPDARKGERPFAAVMLRDGSAATASTILDWARERIAPYKCPRRIFIVDDIPFTFSLKPKRLEVRDRLIAMIEAEGGAGAEPDPEGE
jgi:long-chain acyl-CoA synthetase